MTTALPTAAHVAEPAAVVPIIRRAFSSDEDILSGLFRYDVTLIRKFVEVGVACAYLHMLADVYTKGLLRLAFTGSRSNILQSPHKSRKVYFRTMQIFA